MEPRRFGAEMVDGQAAGVGAWQSQRQARIGADETHDDPLAGRHVPIEAAIRVDTVRHVNDVFRVFDHQRRRAGGRPASGRARLGAVVNVGRGPVLLGFAAQGGTAVQQTGGGLAAVGVIGIGDVDAVGRVDLELAQLHPVEFGIVTRQDDELHVVGLGRFEAERLGFRVRFERCPHDLPKTVRLRALGRCIDRKVAGEQVHRAVALLIAAGRVVQNHAVDGMRSWRSEFEDKFVSRRPLG